MACRSQELAEAAMDKLRYSFSSLYTPSPSPVRQERSSVRLSYLHLNLLSLASVRAAAEQFGLMFDRSTPLQCFALHRHIQIGLFGAECWNIYPAVQHH